MAESYPLSSTDVKSGGKSKIGSSRVFLACYHESMKHTIHTLCAVACILFTLSSCASLSPRVSKEIEMAGPCTVLVFESRAIARGALPTSDLAKVCVSLPASYASSPDRRYPVVYTLPGFGDGALAMLRAIRKVPGENPQDEPEFILVSIDGGTSFYANSPATGNWEDLVTSETVSLIDSRYRTVPLPEGRLLAGFSMGGFGAWNIALKHPDIFCAAWACCPGAWDENGLRDTLRGWDGTYRNAYGAAYAPDLSLPPPYARIPKFDGSPADSAVVADWEQGFGNIKGKLADYSRQGARLTAVCFAYGSNDGYRWIPRGTQYIAGAMSDAGIPVTIQEYPSGHDMSDAMIQNSLLPFLRIVFPGSK
jgi:Predicted esterase